MATFFDFIFKNKLNNKGTKEQSFFPALFACFFGGSKKKTRRPGPAGFGNFPLRSTLRELEAFAGAGLAVFLALAGARVAREETFRLECGAQVGVELQQRAGNRSEEH